jgi:predicted aspartyl protease
VNDRRFRPLRLVEALCAQRVRLVLAVLVAALGSVAGTPALAAGAEDYKKGVTPCMRARDYACAEKNWTEYLRLRPTDSNAIANLAIVMNLRDNHAGAVVQFERAIDLGEGTYDLFSYYADSLAKLGRIDEAIDWSYKALAVVPRLVDVRGKLAKLLVVRQRYHEALALLASFDDDMRGKGQPAYFEGQRIAIETAISRHAADAKPTETALRAAKMGDHYFVPVSLGQARPATFVVDTGASRTMMSEAFLIASKADYKASATPVSIFVADGRRVQARAVTIASLKVGPFELKQAPAVVCSGCAPLLGQSALSKFDLKSGKVQGVEFLTLAPRP